MLAEEVIIVGKELLPPMIAGADMAHIKGLVSESGGVTSHIAIMSRNMEIPAVFGIKGIMDKIEDGRLLAIDGSKGIVQFDVDAELLADIGKQLYEQEEEQYLAYRQAVEGMGGKPVIIRTLDVGGDKEIPYLNLPREGNHFMGYRAIRVCLADKEMFKAQLQAILRASAFGKVRIIYPMISSVEEVISANSVLEEAKYELEARGIEFDRNIEVGILVEIPSAAITADIIVKHVDLFSIGTPVSLSVNILMLLLKNMRSPAYRYLTAGRQ